MRTLTTILTATASAALAGAVVVPTLATASTGSTGVARHVTTLRMAIHPRGGGQVDADPAGMSLGDEFFEHGTLSGDARGRYSLSGELVRMPGRSTPPWESQHFTLRLPGGTVEATGEHPATDSFVVAVVGGTGRWAHASGTLRVESAHAELTIRS